MHVNNFEHGKGTENTITRFDPQANIQYTYESAEALLSNPDDLSKIIKHHAEKQRPRLEVLDAYYLGNNVDILQPNRRKEKDKADHRATHNFAKYVSNFMQGFVVGIPVGIDFPEQDSEESEKKIKAINKKIEADSLNADLELDLSRLGRAYELLHRNQNDQTMVYLSSALETFLIYDRTIEENIIAGVRYFPVDDGEDTTINVMVYTPQKVITFTTNNTGGYELKKEKEENHGFGEVPINEYQNNRFRQGDYECVLDLIDLYDAAQSDLANYTTDLQDALLAILGNVDMDQTTAAKQKQANMLLLKPGQTPEGKEGKIDAKYIYKQYDVSGSEAYKDRIQTDIHKFTNTPDLSDSNFSGNQTGEALKYKLFGLEQSRITKVRMFTKGLNRRYRLINNVGAWARELSDDELSGISFVFTPNLPESIEDSVRLFNDLGGELSEKTKLQLIPQLVDDPDEESKRVEEERKERMKSMSSEYMGEQN